MAPPAPTKSTPNASVAFHRLQAERVAVLQPACEEIDATRKARRSVLKVCKMITARLNGKRFSSAPNQRWEISARTLSNLYYDWCKGGRLPQVFALKYTPHPKVNRVDLEVFVRQLFSPHNTTPAAAYSAFRRCRHRRRAQDIPSLDTLRRYLPSGLIRRLRTSRAAIAEQEKMIAKLRLEADLFVLDAAPIPQVARPFSGWKGFKI